MSDRGQSNEALLFDYLGRHLVAFCGVYVALDTSGKPHGPERSFSASGFVVTVDGVWYVITAGHVLGEHLDDHIRAGRIRLNHCSLADYFGKDAKNHHPTIISYEGVSKFHVDDRGKGLDIGVFQLRDFYVDGLKSNGVLPLSEAEWSSGDTTDVHTFAILGFPDEEKHHDDGETVVGWVRSCLAGVTPCDPPPDAPVTTYPMFVGRLNADEPNSMVGFSGGPIFRFHQEGTGVRYSLHGVQAFWNKKNRVTYGCPMSVVAQLIRTRFGNTQPT